MDFKHWTGLLIPLLFLQTYSQPEFFTQCFQCTNYEEQQYNPLCPLNDTVQIDQVPNSKCSGPCFTRTQASDTQVVQRGCVTSLTDLPAPLPPGEGCYDWQGATICLCYMPMCNMMPMGLSMGVALDGTAAPTTNLPQTTKSSDPIYTQCFECVNYVDDTHNPDCPMNGTVQIDEVSNGQCEGACYTRTVASDPRLVERGCTRSLRSLQQALPPDGCYDWRGATICLCYMPMCNMMPMGRSIGQALAGDPEPTVPAGTVSTPAPTMPTGQNNGAVSTLSSRHSYGTPLLSILFWSIVQMYR